MSTIVVKAEIKDMDIPLFKAIFQRVNAKNISFEKSDNEQLDKNKFYEEIEESLNQVKTGQIIEV
ncbi:TPA: hypothetical protein ACNCGZ_004970, partial [Escherichia coli]|nr:hypothetical protein [Escherichia coli]